MNFPTDHPSVLPTVAAMLCVTGLAALALVEGADRLTTDTALIILAGLAGYNVSKSHPKA